MFESERRRRQAQGFTLIELMIVVAIIGILAAIAVPNFLRFQLRSKTSEGKVNLTAIRAAEECYRAEFGSYVGAGSQPTAAGAPPGLVKLQWPAVAPGFDTIGWSPEGGVLFSYAVAVDAPGSGYTATAEADLDGDSQIQAWAYAKPDATAARVPALPASCDVALLQADTEVGPCDAAAATPTYGMSRF